MSPRSDVFGLGATLYQLLTGELPFPKGTRRTPFLQLDADARPMREHVASLPKDLDTLVLCCFARAPEARPSLSVLLPALNGQIRSGPPMWPEGFKPPRSQILEFVEGLHARPMAGWIRPNDARPRADDWAGLEFGLMGNGLESGSGLNYEGSLSAEQDLNPCG